MFQFTFLIISGLVSSPTNGRKGEAVDQYDVSTTRRNRAKVRFLASVFLNLVCFILETLKIHFVHLAYR